MIGSLTYTYFTLDTYDKLSIRSKELLIDKKEYLKVFSLGNTPLLYSNDNKIKSFYDYFINNKVDLFFETLINYIKYNDYMYNDLVMAYLYSNLANYILSTTLNPYIIYKSGLDNKKISYYLDNYLVSINENINPYKFKCYDFCFNLGDVNKDFIEVINFTYKEVFNINDFYNSYYVNSVNNMKKYYKKYLYDPNGIKKSLNKNILTYHIKNNRDYLNLNHNTWYNPTTKRPKHTESFIDLYVKALDKVSNIIQDINKYLYYGEDINISELIGNLSYLTGTNCDKEKELKYFEF